MKKIVILFLLVGASFVIYADTFDALIETIEYDDFDSFKEVLQKQFTVDQRDEWGFQPLHYAVGWDWTDDLRYVKHLIQRGADPYAKVTNVSGEEYYEFENMSVFHLSVRAGNTAAAKYLVNTFRIDPNSMVSEYTSPMDLAVMDGGLEMVQYLFPLLRNKTVTGSMPHLNLAINHENFHIAEYLIQQGVDINDKSDDFSALHHAVFGHSYNAKIMRMLVEKGAKINDLNRWSDTPLHYAAWEAPNATRYLIENGADLNPINYDGNTPLIEAAIRGNLYSVQHLVAAGADISIRNYEGKTAEDIAIEKGFPELLPILKGERRVAIPDFTLDDEIDSYMTFISRNNGDFELQDLNGNNVKLSDYKGKLVFLNIWATWCPPCRREMPSMQRVYDKLKNKGFEILAVSIDENASDAKSFMDSYKLTFKALHDPMEQLLSETGYSANGYPSTYIIDPNGLTIHSSSGSREWDDPDYMKFLEAFLP